MYKTSTFDWESSYFGGVERMVYDHPFISIPKSVEFVPIDPSGEYRFTKFVPYRDEKKAKILIHRCKKYNLLSHLTNNALFLSGGDSTTTWGGAAYYVRINPSSINYCIKALAKKDVDMSSLFKDENSISALKEKMAIVIEVNPKDPDFNQIADNRTYREQVTKDILSKVKKQDNSSWFSYATESKEISSGNFKEMTTWVKVAETIKKVQYSPTIEKEAKNLVKMLDISFDMKEDKIDSLKCGKMSPQKIAEVPAGNTNVYHRVEHDQTTRPFSIVILCDESGSMHRGGDRQQHHLVKMMYLAFSSIMPADRISVYGHSGLYSPEIRIYQDRYNPTFETTITRQLEQEYRENYDGPVIESIYERVRSQYGNDNILFIVLSDGEPAGHRYGNAKHREELKRVVEKCKRDGFVTVGIGVTGHTGVRKLYTYNTILNSRGENMVRNVSRVVNMAVKTEFQ